jgi:hypothetical protein
MAVVETIVTKLVNEHAIGYPDQVVGSCLLVTAGALAQAYAILLLLGK